MNATIKKIIQRQKRKLRVRRNVSGTSQRPRLTVFRSHNNISAQLIDDTVGRTLVAASSLEKVVRGKITGHSGNKAAAAVVGASLAEKAIQAGITKVVFDRNGYPYHGRVRELADAARKGGLKF